MNKKDTKIELEKCKNDPYYFATKYLMVDEKPFITRYSRKEFNQMILKHKK